jgi:hypothetical protein
MTICPDRKNLFWAIQCIQKILIGDDFRIFWKHFTFNVSQESSTAPGRAAWATTPGASHTSVGDNHAKRGGAFHGFAVAGFRPQ